MRIARSSLIVLWLLALPEAFQGQLPDHQGIAVLRYDAEAQPEESWRVGPPMLTLGEASGREAELFWNVAGVLAIGHDQIVVGDGGSSELRFFRRSTGEHLRTVGGEGPGPGEIDDLRTLWRAGDAIVAVDAYGRASFFDSSGRFLREMPPPVSALGRRLRRAGFFAVGSALAFAIESDSDVPAGRTTVWMRIVTLQGDEPTFLLRYPHHIATRIGDARPWGLVFGPVAALAVSGDRFCVGFPREYMIDCFSREGDPLYRVVREQASHVPVTTDDREDYFSVNEAANPGPRGEPYIRYLRENAQFADEFPAFGRIVAGHDGEIWVGPFVPEGDTPVLNPTPDGATTWSVYSRDGHWVANVSLPPRFQLMFVAADWIAGVIRDELDVERVMILPLQKD